MSVMLPHDDMTASATATSALAWSSQDSAAATAEGWDVFDSSERGLEIERIDDPEDTGGGSITPTFASDDQAIGHVYAKAQEGSALHQKALLMTLTRMKDFAWPAAPNSDALTEAFNECFRVAFQIANTPADNYENDTAWAHAMHSAAYRAYPTFQQVRAMLGAAPAASPLVSINHDGTQGEFPVPDAQVDINLDREFTKAMYGAVAEQTWMPAEYMANDWKADILNYLRNGPGAFAAPTAVEFVEDEMAGMKP